MVVAYAETSVGVALTLSRLSAVSISCRDNYRVSRTPACANPDFVPGPRPHAATPSRMGHTPHMPSPAMAPYVGRLRRLEGTNRVTHRRRLVSQCRR
jgi:hypothetical protein